MSNFSLDEDGVREINRAIKKIDSINGPNVSNNPDTVSIGGAQAGAPGRDGEDAELDPLPFAGMVLIATADNTEPSGGFVFAVNPPE